MSVHDETWNKCHSCKETMKDWHYLHSEDGCYKTKEEWSDKLFNKPKNVTKGRSRLSWEETALRLAFNIANYRSQDPFVQVGATIIKNDGSILLGYNGAPSGQEIDWSDRNNRRERVIHGEENVLTWVKPGEVKIMACTALPCKACMKTIAHKKIKKLIYRDELDGYNNEFSKELAKEFGIELIQLNINI